MVHVYWLLFVIAFFIGLEIFSRGWEKGLTTLAYFLGSAAISKGIMSYMNFDDLTAIALMIIFLWAWSMSLLFFALSVHIPKRQGE
jgi:hypothetical protein